jgi:hypothetical protein
MRVTGFLVMVALWRADLARRWQDDAGEGVMSAALAVLIMAILGVALWGVLNGSMSSATGRITEAVNNIGG